MTIVETHNEDQHSSAATGCADVVTPRAAAIGDGETVLLVARPSPVMIVHLGRRWCAAALAVVGLSIIAGILGDVPIDIRHGIAVCALILLVRISWRVIEWSNTMYVLTDRRLVHCKGPRARMVDMPLRLASLIEIEFPAWGRPIRVGSIGFRAVRDEPERLRWTHVSKPQEVRRAVLDARSRYGR